MAHGFASATIVTELARDAARTPPPTDDAQTYFDRSIHILGRTFGVQRREMQSQLQNYNIYITDNINMLKRDVDERIRQLEAKMDKRFQEVDKRFQEVDKRFQEKLNIAHPYKAAGAGKLSETVRELAAFYEVVVYSDEQSDSEGTEVDVQSDVDAYMEALLDKIRNGLVKSL
ncbi:predicted protein [Histoplasma mississippiense (nom. inval.)]|uniref:predicted protein n=1 Tax=Ajellomyces capsulatus (strain NAm1 / WU24) TaxID=2059318 RepID=UPI000157B495|nr:predicted protein [Histoplasma mississippiense (nom. inval.)]EDN02788.1 predicted protein [Histoplasma mississippiense (nom. inval.)]